MHRSGLYQWHVSHNARMIEFAGWEMPLYFTSIIEEHQAVRGRAGLFDLSHMGRIRINGPERIKFIQYMTTNDVEGLEQYGVQYSLLCNKQGGIINDITVYRREDYLLLVVNGINRNIDMSWLNQHKAGYNVEIVDMSESMAMVAIQGPKAEAILQRIAPVQLRAIEYYHFAVVELSGYEATVSRTGYTGEDGFELYFDATYLRPLWERLLEEGTQELSPVGLGGRDSLRIEACFPLYGNELTPFTTPFEARLIRFVKMEKGDFIGKTALLHSTTDEFTRQLVAFEMEDRAVPRKDCQIMSEGVPMGHVTSGTFSPTFKKGIGMGYVDQYRSKAGTEIEVIIANKDHKAKIVKKPFYKRRKKK